MKATLSNGTVIEGNLDEINAFLEGKEESAQNELSLQSKEGCKQFYPEEIIEGKVKKIIEVLTLNPNEKFTIEELGAKVGLTQTQMIMVRYRLFLLPSKVDCIKEIIPKKFMYQLSNKKEIVPERREIKIKRKNNVSQEFRDKNARRLQEVHQIALELSKKYNKSEKECLKEAFEIHANKTREVK